MIVDITPAAKGPTSQANVALKQAEGLLKLMEERVHAVQDNRKRE